LAHGNIRTERMLSIGNANHELGFSCLCPEGTRLETCWLSNWLTEGGTLQYTSKFYGPSNSLIPRISSPPAVTEQYRQIMHQHNDFRPEHEFIVILPTTRSSIVDLTNPRSIYACTHYLFIYVYVCLFTHIGPTPTCIGAWLHTHIAYTYRMYLKRLGKLQEWLRHIKTRETVHINICQPSNVLISAL
jgi:hypothetical protein